MFTNIYLVECLYRNTRTMNNNYQSKVFRQKAFENENDALNYYFHLQDSLLMNGFEFVCSPDFNYNAFMLRKETLPFCDLKKGFRLFKICVKLIPVP